MIFPNPQSKQWAINVTLCLPGEDPTSFGLLLLSQSSTLAGRGDLENAQTTVTVEIASQATIVRDTAVQHNTCPVLPGFQA